MSDRLDIVRLIDARVTSTRRTVTRSKQLTEAAKGDLHIHEDWLRQHNERFGHDLKRQQGSIKRRERIENNKRFAKTALLFLPRLGTGLCRGVVSGFCKADDVFLAGCAWLGRTAYAFGRSLIEVLGGAGASAGSQALRLGLMLAAAFWLNLSWLGKCARALALASMRASLRGFSWLGPKASSFGRSLTASLSLGLSQFATGIGGVSLEAGGGVKRQASNLIRLRPRATAPERRQAPDLDPSRLQQAAFIRLRAEHDRLQRRIHAMDRHYEQRASHRAHADAKEWVELRKLALDARRLFEAEERQVLGPAAPRGETRNSPVGDGPSQRTRIPPLRAGHAVYEAPALPAGHRRA